MRFSGSGSGSSKRVQRGSKHDDPTGQGLAVRQAQGRRRACWQQRMPWLSRIGITATFINSRPPSWTSLDEVTWKGRRTRTRSQWRTRSRIDQHVARQSRNGSGLSFLWPASRIRRRTTTSFGATRESFDLRVFWRLSPIPRKRPHKRRKSDRSISSRARAVDSSVLQSAPHRERRQSPA